MARFGAGRRRRIQRQVGQEALAAGGGGRQLLELLEVAEARARVVVEPRRGAARTSGARGPSAPPTPTPGRTAGDRARRRPASRRAPPRAARSWPSRAARGRAQAGHVAQQRVGQARAHARQQLRDPERGQAVARVLGPAQAGQRVLDVRGLEEAQPAELHERDVAAPELDLQRVAVVAAAKQDRLLAQRHARPRAVRGSAGRRSRPAPPRRRPWRAPACRRRRASREAACRSARRPARSPRWRRPGSAASSGSSARSSTTAAGGVYWAGKARMLSTRRGAEAVDGLRVVADDRHAAAVGAQAAQDLGLQRVRVLVLVDEHVVESAPIRRANGASPIRWNQ